MALARSLSFFSRSLAALLPPPLPCAADNASMAANNCLSVASVAALFSSTGCPPIMPVTSAMLEIPGYVRI